MRGTDGNPLPSVQFVCFNGKHSLLTRPHRKRKGEQYSENGIKRTESTIPASTPHYVFARAVTEKPILLAREQTALIPGLSLCPSPLVV